MKVNIIEFTSGEVRQINSKKFSTEEDFLRRIKDLINNLSFFSDQISFEIFDKKNQTYYYSNLEDLKAKVRLLWSHN